MSCLSRHTKLRKARVNPMLCDVAGRTAVRARAPTIICGEVSLPTPRMEGMRADQGHGRLPGPELIAADAAGTSRWTQHHHRHDKVLWHSTERCGELLGSEWVAT